MSPVTGKKREVRRERENPGAKKHRGDASGQPQPSFSHQNSTYTCVLKSCVGSEGALWNIFSSLSTYLQGKTEQSKGCAASSVKNAVLCMISATEAPSPRGPLY